MEVKEKICIKCGITKSIDKYYKSKVHISGRENTCKDCRTKRQIEIGSREYSKKYYAENKEKENARGKIRYQKNKEDAKSKSRERTLLHGEEINRKLREKRKNNPNLNKEACKKYRLKNKEKLSQSNKKWRNEQSEEYFENENKKKREKYKSDPDLRKRVTERSIANTKDHCKRKSDLWLRNLMRIRIITFFKNENLRKNKKSIHFLGADFKTIIRYFDLMGYDRLNQDLDHIVPLSAFNIRNENHQLIMFHYYNLKPENSYYNRHVKQNKLTNDWKEIIIKIGKIRNINTIEIIEYIQTRLSNKELRFLNG